MNSSTQQKTPRGRSFLVLAFGNTAAELEQAALDEARAFFGDGPVLRVAQDYIISSVIQHSTFTEPAAGRKYKANLLVRAVPSAQARLCGLLRGLRTRMQAGRP